jgi:hypothetical protein
MIDGHLGELFTGLFDDASMFPPQDEPPSSAVAGHLAHRMAWYADMVGPFVCSAGRLSTINDLAARHGVDRLAVAVVVPGGLQALLRTVDTARECKQLRVAGIEVPLGQHALVDALSHLVPLVSQGLHVYLEIPVYAVTEHDVHTLAPSGVRLKLRTGGTSIEAFQTEENLARPIVLCAAERLAFKCTAGLHNAIRHRDRATLFEHHGFLNIALAARVAAGTGSQAATRRILAEQDPGAVAQQVGALTAADVRAIRALFNSFGTCSIAEPVGDLLQLGLVSAS